MTVSLYTKQGVQLNRKEIYRYLGCKGVPAAELSQRIETIAAQAERQASVRIAYLSVPICVTENNICFEGFSPIFSRKLADNLRDTDRAVLFCATCGVYFDRKIAAARLQPSEAVIWDAVGTAAIEQFCDDFCAQMHTIRPRFSPGYGDLPLSFQKDFLQWLNATQLLGVGLTDSLLMTPTKSVSAIAAQESI